MPVSVAEREYLLRQVGRLAQTDLNNLWRQAEQLATEDFFTFVRDGFVEIADTYHQATGQLAATWFEESDPASAYLARVAEPITPERLLKSAEWALGGDGVQGLSRMQGSMQRAVYDGARDTVVLNAEATRSRWIRVARANACEFCRMLATRSGDYAYLSRESATAVTGTAARNRRQGARKMGSKFHDDCYCTAVEVRGNQSVEDVLPEEKLRLYQQWTDEYEKAVANAGTTDTKKVLAAWREQTTLQPSLVEDITAPQTNFFDQLPRITAPSLEEAVTSSNPGFNPSVFDRRADNCSHCVTAFDMRRRGIAVQATEARTGADGFGIGRTFNEVLSNYTDANGENRAPQELMVTGGRGRQVRGERSDLDEIVRSWGDGARGFVAVIFRGGNGHILAVENVGGEVRYIDPQSAKLDASRSLNKTARRKGTPIVYARVDDLAPSQKIFDPADPLVEVAVP